MLCILILTLTACIKPPSRNLSENSNPQASATQNENEKMIEENTIRLEPLFSSGDYYYDSYKTAQLFAKDLNSVGVMTIVDIKIENDTEYPEDVLLAFITDERDLWDCVVSKANAVMK